MNKAKDRYQGMRWCKRRGSPAILNSLLAMALLFFSRQAVTFAQTCNTTSVTASTPTANFTVNNDGTVTDTKTHLTWKVCSEGQSGAACATGAATAYTWGEALTQAQTVNGGSGFAGHKDWRVPNIKELASIVERQCTAPAINIAIFPGTDSNNNYWSSSSYAGGGANAWVVDFNGGTDGTYFKGNISFVRLVRGGQ